MWDESEFKEGKRDGGAGAGFVLMDAFTRRGMDTSEVVENRRCIDVFFERSGLTPEIYRELSGFRASRMRSGPIVFPPCYFDVSTSPQYPHHPPLTQNPPDNLNRNPTPKTKPCKESRHRYPWPSSSSRT